MLHKRDVVNIKVLKAWLVPFAFYYIVHITAAHSTNQINGLLKVLDTLGKVLMMTYGRCFFTY